MTIAGGTAGNSWKLRLFHALPERLRVALGATTTYRRKMGRWPNLVWPTDFTEQVQRRKIFDRDPRLPILADKLLVKDYVRVTLGEDWIIPTLWSGKKLPPLADRNWPIPFVVKVNSGCGWNIFVRKPADLDWPSIEEKCAHWLATPYGVKWGEWLYSRIDPQILIEPLISPDQPYPDDYKFFVFRGKVHCVYVVTDRGGELKVTFFTPAWQRMDGGIAHYPRDMRNLPPPACLNEMVAAAAKLGADFDFVRVDFYDVGGVPKFGELTFYPGSGYLTFPPHSFSRELLKLWRDK